MEINIFIAVVISFLISAVLCPVFIPLLKKFKFGQNIREEGPQSHLSKKGTPTMGGIVMVLSIVITSLLFVKDYPRILPVIFVTVAFALVGFLDDYLKVIKNRSMVLRAWQKFLLQIVITVLFI
ncbi:MAG: phospho-N-acetylmuramoyl-pentapeptide-transferase, partial [Clostridiales bacterium]|nr:phospho-N-acetylmuramoyl-pentapeptide-transferase [Clostridiales bacterium]